MRLVKLNINGAALDAYSQARVGHDLLDEVQRLRRMGCSGVATEALMKRYNEVCELECLFAKIEPLKEVEHKHFRDLSVGDVTQCKSLNTSGGQAYMEFCKVVSEDGELIKVEGEESGRTFWLDVNGCYVNHKKGG